VAAAAATAVRVGLVATFEGTLRSMPSEFPAGVKLECVLAPGALAALNAGDVQRHDDLVVQAALEAVQRGCRVIALAQFSMAHAQSQVGAATGLPVLTTVDSSVAMLKQRLSSSRA
jgi:Asp/Glu/hydantoin racemase